MNPQASEINLGTVGDRLRWARSQKGLSQADLAEKSGVAQATISKIEVSSQNKSKFVGELSKALGLNLSWLAAGSGAPWLHDDNPDNQASPKQTKSRSKTFMEMSELLHQLSDTDLLSLHQIVKTMTDNKNN